MLEICITGLLGFWVTGVLECWVGARSEPSSHWEAPSVRALRRWPDFDSWRTGFWTGFS